MHVFQKEITPPVIETNLHTEIHEYLYKVMYATLSHKPEQILPLCDPAYKLDQHDNNLSGNTKQFVNELYCQFSSDYDKYICYIFQDIQSIKTTNISKTSSEYTVTFYVVTSEYKFTLNMTIIERNEGNIIKYGIVGAYA
jgi:hypothetical protein